MYNNHLKIKKNETRIYFQFCQILKITANDVVVSFTRFKK